MLATGDGRRHGPGAVRQEAHGVAQGYRGGGASSRWSTRLTRPGCPGCECEGRPRKECGGMSVTATGERTQPGGVRKRAVIAAVIGNFIEWYDFTLYGYLAVVIASLFFPTENRLVSLLATFAVFGVAFVMRPIGALVFGSIGDRIGRRNTLAAIILITSGGTFFIGLVPSYESIGILAPLLLVLARVVQGFAVGGEYGGATSFIVEYAPEDKRGLYGSWLFVTQGASLIVGLLIVTV